MTRLQAVLDRDDLVAYVGLAAYAMVRRPYQGEDWAAPKAASCPSPRQTVTLATWRTSTPPHPAV